VDLYTLIAGWAGWPVVVAFLLVVGGYGLWAFNNRLEGLKEKNEFLQLKLDEMKTSSPDLLLERLSGRYKILSEELERLDADEQANKQEISKLEVERENIAAELGDAVSQLFKSIDSVQGYDCVFCFSHDIHHVQIPVELAGRKFTFDMNATCYKCGRRKTQVTAVSSTQ
jgi:hypothetical protein